MDNALLYNSNAFRFLPVFASAAALLVKPLVLFGSISNNLSKYVTASSDLPNAIKTEPLFSSESV